MYHLSSSFKRLILEGTDSYVSLEVKSPPQSFCPFFKTIKSYSFIMSFHCWLGRACGFFPSFHQCLPLSAASLWCIHSLSPTTPPSADDHLAFLGFSSTANNISIGLHLCWSSGLEGREPLLAIEDRRLGIQCVLGDSPTGPRILMVLGVAQTSAYDERLMTSANDKEEHER